MKLSPALLILSLAISGCAAKSPHTRPAICPEMPPLPESLKRPLNAEQRLSQLLLESEPRPMQSSED